MMRSLITSSIRFRDLVVAIAAVVTVVGVRQLRDMPVAVLPEFSLPYVEIQTEALGLSAEEVEQLITLGMEQDLLNGVPWVQVIRSESMPGLSSVIIVFKRGTDLMKARQMVEERLSQAYVLPHVSKPPTMIQPLSATSRFLVVGLSSQSLSAIQMSVLARWTIVPRLKGVSGVANVAIWGFRDRQLQVQVDPKRLRDHGVSLLQVLETTGNALWWSSLSFVEASTPGTGGFIDTQNQRLGIRHVFPIVSPEGLAQVPLEGKALRLGDVADVVEDHQPLIGDALTKAGPGLLLVVEKFPAANTLQVTHDVEAALAELLPGLQGLELNTGVFRQADFIETAMHHLATAALVGLALLVLLLAAFFYDWRAVLVSAVAFVVSMVAAGLVLDLTGATINVLVLTGLTIAVGLVVYNAVIDVDNVRRRLRLEEGHQSAAHVIVTAILEARPAVTYATVVVLLAMAPIWWIGGTVGAFFRPLAAAYVLAVLASMAVAWTVTPALCMLLMARASGERRMSPIGEWVQRVWEPMVARMLPRRRLASVVGGVLILFTLVVLRALTFSPVPSFRERNLVVQVEGPPGTSQTEMTRISERISREVQAIPGVRDVGTHVGRAILGDRPVDVHSAELWVSLDPAADNDRTAVAIDHVVAGYPGLRHDVGNYLDQVTADLTAKSAHRIVTRVYGETEVGLRRVAGEVKSALDGIDGLGEPHIDLPVQQAALEAEVDIAAANRYGLKPGDVRRAAATLMSGLVVGNLFEEQKVFEVVVWSTPATRQSLTSIRNLMIDTPGGGQVRLGDVARVRVVSASSVIPHEAVKRYVDVTTTVRGRTLEAAAADIQSRLAQLRFPLEYHAEVLGQYAERGALRTRLLILAMAALIGMLFVLQAAFGSWRLSSLVFLSLPAALSGGALVALATGADLSLGTLAGLFAVFGVAVYNAIVLILRYQSLERDYREAFGPGLVLRGVREQVSPILMTMVGLGLGLVPALLLGDVPGLEVLRPMAMVTLGGLVSTAVVDLLLLPGLFLSLGVRAPQELNPLVEAPGEPMVDAVSASPGMARS
jgi:Cu/Ag efflux pump CusA